jgi:signal transduction histidine kinase
MKPIPELEGHPVSIMVVDDQPANLKLLEDILKVEGYHIRSFPRGRMALAAATNNPPDLFLLDINMPEMNGYEVCGRLKSDPELSPLPVIFLSALNATEDKVKAFEAGGADYITKPFQIEEVQARVQTHLKMRHLQQELKLHNDSLEQTVEQRTSELKLAAERMKSMYEESLRAQDASRQQEQRLAREKVKIAESSNAAKSEFLANMSHELRTPLNGIVGITELALKTELTVEQKEYLDIIKRSADSLLNVVDEILDFSKIEGDDVELGIIDFDLCDCVESTLKTLAPQAHGKGLELLCELREGLPAIVRADPGRLRNVLGNLVGNAIKFTEAGEVGVRVEAAAGKKEDSFLHFTVCDTGLGIPSEKLSAIFDSFTQADTSTTRKSGGTGLGLTVAKRLVELMGGSIWVDSEPGVGSHFHFTVRSGTEELPAAVLENAAPPAILKGMKILIVDDNGANRRILKALVEGWGMDSRSVLSAQQAADELLAAERFGAPYALVLANMHMPKLDGFGLVGQLKERMNRSPATIMMMASGVQPGDVARCADLGISAWLSKPVRRGELYEAITLVLQNKSEPSSGPRSPAR